MNEFVVLRLQEALLSVGTETGADQENCSIDIASEGIEIGLFR